MIYIRYTFPPKRINLGYPPFIYGKIIKQTNNIYTVDFFGDLFFEPITFNIDVHRKNIEFLTEQEFLVRKVLDE